MSTPVSNHQGMDDSGPGKKAVSVGHLAKAAVSAAREDGVDVPKNAQGMAASATARGIDPAGLFAALVGLSPTPGDPGGADSLPDDGATNGSDSADGAGPAEVTDITPVSEGSDVAMLASDPDAGNDEVNRTPSNEPVDVGEVVLLAASDIADVVGVAVPLETAPAILSEESADQQSTT